MTKNNFSFFKLKVYEQAVRLSALILELAAHENKYPSLWELICKEALQIPQKLAYASNFKESSRRISILEDCRGSCYRLVAILEIGKRKRIFTETNLEILIEELESLCRKIANLIFSLEEEGVKI